MMIALAACRRDANEPTPTGTSAMIAEPVDPSDGTDTTWDYFSADETITSTGPIMGGSISPEDGVRSVAYHMVRSRKTDGSWQTVINYEPVTPFGPVPADSRHTVIARVENDEDNNMRMFDTQGRQLKALEPFPDSIHPAGAAAARAATAARAPSASPLAAFGAPSSTGAANTTRKLGKRGSRDWLDNILVTPATQRRNRDAIKRRFGEAKEHVNKKDRYVKSENGRTVEILVDPAIGAITELNVAEQGRLREHTKYSYALFNDSVYVRTTTRREYLPPNSDKRLIIESTLKNVRVSRRGTR